MGVDNAAVARRYLTEIWAKGNLDVLDELVDDEISLQDPMTPSPAVGKQEIRKRVEEMKPMFSDNDIAIKDVIVSGDRVVVLHTWRGKHIGDFFNVKPTNKTISCDSVEILRITNGKVVEDITYFDQYSMFQQMGVLPPPEQLKQSDVQPAEQPAEQPRA